MALVAEAREQGHKVNLRVVEGSKVEVEVATQAVVAKVPVEFHESPSQPRHCIAEDHHLGHSQSIRSPSE